MERFLIWSQQTRNSSSSWEDSGVAFISPEPDGTKFTYGRMWKVTSKQFSEIWKQEGKSWRYDKKIDLGYDENGLPIWTITSSSELQINEPSNGYLKTIIAGLKETYHLSNKAMSKYLIEKPGIKGKLTEKDIMAICQSV